MNEFDTKLTIPDEFLQHLSIEDYQAVQASLLELADLTKRMSGEEQHLYNEKGVRSLMSDFRRADKAFLKPTTWLIIGIFALSVLYLLHPLPYPTYSTLPVNKEKVEPLLKTENNFNSLGSAQKYATGNSRHNSNKLPGRNKTIGNKINLIKSNMVFIVPPLTTNSTLLPDTLDGNNHIAFNRIDYINCIVPGQSNLEGNSIGYQVPSVCFNMPAYECQPVLIKFESIGNYTGDASYETEPLKLQTHESVGSLRKDATDYRETISFSNISSDRLISTHGAVPLIIDILSESSPH